MNSNKGRTTPMKIRMAIANAQTTHKICFKSSMVFASYSSSTSNTANLNTATSMRPATVKTPKNLIEPIKQATYAYGVINHIGSATTFNKQKIVHKVKSKILKILIFLPQLIEPPAGLEPTIWCLRDICSTN